MEREGAWSLLVDRLADESVPVLLREEVHAYLTGENSGNGLGYDAFLDADANAEAVRAWQAWAANRPSK